ncbi:MAG: hypothetical protein IJS58_04775 [Bacilli bacterium]|nr:hypothetical protein [Bacilli bacterium]
MEDIEYYQKRIVELTDLEIQTNGKLNDIQRVQLDLYKKIYLLLKRINNGKEKAQEVKDHIDKSKFDGMTKSILLMAINEIVHSLNGKENTD